MLLDRYDKREVPRQHALDFETCVLGSTNGLACLRKALEIVETQMETSVKMQPLLGTTKHLCGVHSHLSASRLAHCYSPLAKLQNEGLIKPRAPDI